MMNILTPQKYILVNTKDPSQIMHVNSVIFTKNNNRIDSVTTIPIFDSLKSVHKFQHDILKKKHIRSDWYVSNDMTTNECVVYTHIVNNQNDRNDFAAIKEFDMENETDMSKIVMNNTGLFYIEDFWLKEHKEQLLLTGRVWMPPSKKGEQSSYYTEIARESYEHLYLN